MPPTCMHWPAIDAAECRPSLLHGDDKNETRQGPHPLIFMFKGQRPLDKQRLDILPVLPTHSEANIMNEMDFFEDRHGFKYSVEIILQIHIQLCLC